jgi:hypothetical protein
MKIVPPLKNERGMNAALKTQQSLNLLLQAGHTWTRSEFVTPRFGQSVAGVEGVMARVLHEVLLYFVVREEFKSH